MQNTTTEKRKITTQQMALVAIMTALTCILAPFSLPIGPCLLYTSRGCCTDEKYYRRSNCRLTFHQTDGRK